MKNNINVIARARQTAKWFNIKSILLAGALALTSCESSLDTINENPNDPASIDPKYLLTFVSKYTFQVDGDNMYASRMMIGTDGENTYQYMKWNDASFEVYTKGLLNTGKMIQEAEKINNKNYIAIGKFFRAYHFFNISLKVGSAPYSEAAKGESGITQPKYDTQDAIMSGILSELKEANDLINTNDKIEGDIVFGGDALKWKKLINSFRLKILITLSKKTTVGSYNIATEFAAIAASQPLMTSISDNGELKFADAADSRYSMFNNSGYGSSLYMADYFINLFKDRHDPRLFTFAAQTTGAKEAGKAITDFTGYNGGNPTSPYSDNAALITAKNISKVNDRFYKDATNEPASVLSYSELEFILAEAAARGWISGSAKTHYDNAIKASFTFYQTYVKNPGQYFTGFDVNQYLTTPLVVYNNSAPLETQVEKIITQKYMTMFHQAQWTSYYDYLRTGYPNYPLKAGVPAPFRFRYPQSEYSYNNANLKAALTTQYGGNDNINSKPWWLQ
ncbi:SusD/RagB family nutrient-binding outer membrane lipoprotein [Chryseobacterium joostei]|uniref:Starch-binding associating with outer membrane n=1 Tax=Chryseobacterium joostei TaxID=112234 RepID=A0A1N7III2_9FLAO|nr:SusD/RagB family nutrient-binding outer membrane lipoprotein [Chryseobacterium joostei]AZB00451.1 SusD/RagB family nutrient-binding outer membrane lipoprotein [Chryseobacterium joostei]SIS36889.1 Starch-binding associating with outer membrane [Chryseobacterium joostei]